MPSLDRADSWPLLTTDAQLRRARIDDVCAIVGLLRDDEMGAQRESTDVADYLAAFEAIDRDPNQLLVVLTHQDVVAGTCQLTFTPGLTHRGATRLTIEGVRIASDLRGHGYGALMMNWALDRARERDVGLVQLTTDKSRDAARRFYEQLGFCATHEGMKLPV